MATKLIGNKIGKVLNYSPVVESEPWGFKAETTFYNQILLVKTEFSPQTVLTKILEIENTLGRKRIGKEYSSRSIDIDILFYDEMQIHEDNLVIPHPLLHKRKFILEPLSTIAAELIHPALHLTVTEILQQVKDNSRVFNVIEKDEFAKLLNQQT